MNIIHIESGLGNQMLEYAEYLAIQSITEAECYVETISYDISECNEGISQWNGFELTRIFGIKPPNIKEYLGDEAYLRVVQKVRDSRFWEKHWNYPPYIVEALHDEGINVKAYRGEVHFPSSYMKCPQTEPDPAPEKALLHKIIEKVGLAGVRYYIHHKIDLQFQDYIIRKTNEKSKIFIPELDNAFLGGCLGLMRHGSGIEKMEKDLRTIFRFKEFTDIENIKMKDIIINSNSVSLHVRRGDFIAINGAYYKLGYFKKAVKLIRRNVSNPVFFVFSDPDSREWCKHNLKVLGLSDKDEIYYVNHNKGQESYRDMQLMSLCKHNIITNSSFGWWASLLNENPNKITCSPNVLIYSTHTV